MIPVEQCKPHGPPDGDCFAAGVASILELPIEAVPNPTGDGWWAVWERFLAGYNLAPIEIGISDAEQRPWTPPGYALLAADSPRGPFLHSVVVKDGQIVWDPHPQRALGVGTWRTWTVFVVLDPSWPGGSRGLVSGGHNGR